jgi:primase-polymerase (primpol)-like protein
MNVPRELRESRRAVVWKREVRDGRPTKVPYVPQRPTRRAAVDDPATWGSFTDALFAVEAGFADGVGIVLGDGLVGVDLDHCRDQSGVINPFAMTIVQAITSYTEVSPSGTGVHVLARGALPPGGRRKGCVEMYERARYFTITGVHVQGTPETIEQRTAALAALHARLFRQPEDRPAPRPSGPRRVDPDDAALLERALGARNGVKFAALWRGDWSGYPSQSEADLALCSTLSFWTDGDPGRVDRLFRRSGLYRPKWERDDYRERTIATAIMSR